MASVFEELILPYLSTTDTPTVKGYLAHIETIKPITLINKILEFQDTDLEDEKLHPYNTVLKNLKIKATQYTTNASKKKSTLPSSILSIEFKFAIHLSKRQTKLSDDYHVVKELITSLDGETEPGIRIISNYMRPYYITKPYYRNHTQKKEVEDIKKLDKYFATESDLPIEINLKLNNSRGTNVDIRTMAKSPFVYGIDTSSEVYIAKTYNDIAPVDKTPYTVCGLDIETDIVNKEITLISVMFQLNIHTVVTKKFINNRCEDKFKRDVHSEFDKYYRKMKSDPYSGKFLTKNLEDLNKTIDIVDTPMSAITNIFSKIHEWKPDFLEIWNVTFDIGEITRTCGEYGVDPKDVFSDPSVPEELRFFKYNKGMDGKKTVSGKYKPLENREKWVHYTIPASFYIIDGMQAYNFVRVNTKNVLGGYGLSNILKTETGLTKMEFEGINLKGRDLHIYASTELPEQYAAYNMFDNVSMDILDTATNDISLTIPLLSGYSPFRYFNSTPKRIVDALGFYCIEQGKVLGCRDNTGESNDVLGLKGWISTLDNYMVVDSENQVLEETKDAIHNVRLMVYDSDAVAAYPTALITGNVSKSTTVTELVKVNGVSKETFKNQNMNLLYGKVNNIEWCTSLMNFEKLENY